VDASALAALATVRRDPGSSLLTRGGATTSALALQALNAIDRRFSLRLVERGGGGLAVLELGRRKPL